MKHGLTQDERRARARVVCVIAGFALAVLGVVLWLTRPAREPTSTSARGATTLEAAPALAAGVETLDEVDLYGARAGTEVDAFGMTLPETAASIPEGAMFETDATGAPESAARAGAIVQHGALFSAGHARDEAAASSKALRAPERGARAGSADPRAARADDYNETVVKRASFRACWEASPGATGKVSVKIVVDPAGGVSVYPVAAPQVPDIVVSCVAARARSLPLRVPADGGPRTFDVSSSYSRQIM
jgi:hypothetical protein